MLKEVIIVSLCFFLVSACALTETPEREVETQTGTNSEADTRSSPAINDSLSPVPPDRVGVPAMKLNKDLSAEYVKRVQAHLKSCGFYSGSVDGIVGPRTQSAVQRFRSGCVTLKDMIRAPETARVESSPGAFASKSGADKKLGARSEEIRLLQLRLKDAGFDPGPIDGVEGVRTRTALFALKSGCAMLGDFSALADYPARPRNNGGAMSGTTTAALTSGFTVGNLAADAPGKLKKQTNREAIMALQVRLRDAGFDPGPVDGIFGPRTKSALLGYEASVR